MDVKLYYNAKGDYIAFQKDDYLYDIDGRWIGWFPRGDEVIYDTNNVYLATAIENRLYVSGKLEKTVYNGAYPKFKGYPKMFKFPKPEKPADIPSGYQEFDVKIPFL